MPTLDEIGSALQAAHDAGNAGDAQQLADAYRAQQAATPPEGKDLGPVVAGVHGALDSATFGLGDEALSKMLPSSMYATYKANAEVTGQANPLSSLAGEGAGMVLGGGLLGLTAKGLRAVPVAGKLVQAAELQKAQPFKNAVRMGTTGAALSGATAAASGDDPTQVGISAALGGVAGPVVGTVIGSGARMIGSASQKAWRLMADKIGEDPDVIQSAMQNYQAVTGRNPSMPEVLNMQSRGELQQVARANPNIAEPLNALDANPTQAGLTRNRLSEARDANFKSAVDPIRDNIIPLNPNEMDVLQNEVLPAVSIAKASPLRSQIANDVNQGGISVGAADTIRQRLWQLHTSNPGQGYDELAKQVQQTAETRAPKYGDAMEQYRADSRFLDGFNHSMQGKSEGDAGDGLLRPALATDEGQAGLKLGQVTKQGRDAIASVAPSSLATDDSASQLGHAAGGSLAHSPSIAAYHLASLTAARLRMPPQAADQIGKMFSDPSQTQNAIGMLRQAGASNQQIRNLAIGGAAAAGMNFGNTQSGVSTDVPAAAVTAAQDTGAGARGIFSAFGQGP